MEEKTVEYICPFCGNDKMKICKVINLEIGECTLCEKRIYEKDLKNKTFNQFQPVRCPYCSSTNVTKITTASKVKNALLFGAFAISKNSKEWRCHNCKSEF